MGFWDWLLRRRKAAPVPQLPRPNKEERLLQAVRGRIIDRNIEEARALLTECMGRFRDDDLRERIRKWMESTKH